jgi:hypothetical protein
MGSSIFVGADGQADIVASSPGGSLMYYWATPGSGWRSAQVAGAGQAYLGGSIFVRTDGEVDIAARESGPVLMYYAAKPGSEMGEHEGSSIAATAAASPTVAGANGVD